MRSPRVRNVTAPNRTHRRCALARARAPSHACFVAVPSGTRTRSCPRLRLYHRRRPRHRERSLRIVSLSLSAGVRACARVRLSAPLSTRHTSERPSRARTRSPPPRGHQHLSIPVRAPSACSCSFAQLHATASLCHCQRSGRATAAPQSDSTNSGLPLADQPFRLAFKIRKCCGAYRTATTLQSTLSTPAPPNRRALTLATQPPIEIRETEPRSRTGACAFTIRFSSIISIRWRRSLWFWASHQRECSTTVFYEPLVLVITCLVSSTVRERVFACVCTSEEKNKSQIHPTRITTLQFFEPPNSRLARGQIYPASCHSLRRRRRRRRARIFDRLNVAFAGRALQIHVRRVDGRAR